MTTRALAEVIGAGAREIRTEAGLTLEQVARAMREHGFRWTTARVVELENGKRAVTVQTLLAIVFVLARLTGGDAVSVSRIIHGSGRVALSDGLAIEASALRRMLSSEEVKLTLGDVYPEVGEQLGRSLKDAERSLKNAGGLSVPLGVLAEVESRAGDAESRAARALGVDRLSLAAASAAIWGRTLSAERDARVEADANPQKRGQVTRALLAEVREHLARTEQGGDSGEH